MGAVAALRSPCRRSSGHARGRRLEQFTPGPVFAYNLAQALRLLTGGQEATMGCIESMAIGNPVPDMPLFMGSMSGVVMVLLAVLAVAALGILRALPARARMRPLRLVHAEGR